MLQRGHGAQGVVHIQRADGSAHVFNVINDHGQVHFLDAQTGVVSWQNVDHIELMPIP